MLRPVTCIAIFLVIGCATPQVKPLTPKQEVAAGVLTNIEQSCKGSQEARKAGQAQAECSLAEDFSDLHFTFQNQEAYRNLAVSVSNLVQGFCLASEMYTGKWQKYSWVFEEERESYSRLCRSPKSPENPTEKK